MSEFRINCMKVLNIEPLDGADYKISLSLQMTDWQKREAAAQLLGAMPTDKVEQFLRAEFAELFDDAAPVAQPVPRTPLMGTYYCCEKAVGTGSVVCPDCAYATTNGAAPAPEAQPCTACHVCDCQEAGIACQRTEPTSVAWPLEAHPLTQAIQRLNRISYNIQKSECIEVLRHLRAELAAPPAAARVTQSDDMVLVPRGLIGAACHAIDRKRDAPATLEALRRYTTGDLSAAARVPPAFDLIEHLRRQMDFSARTYGPGDRTAGVCDHIRKELNEVQDDAAAGVPTLGEWVDVIILGFDGAWRSGATPEQIVAAIVAKQTKNEGRKWPDWRTADRGKAIEHDRSGEAAGQEGGAA